MTPQKHRALSRCFCYTNLVTKMFFTKPLFKDFFITAIVIAVVHYLALNFYLYWTIGWLDILVHFLGGFLIGLFVIFFAVSYSKLENLGKYKIIIFSLVIGITLAVGLLWELWEVFVGFTDTLTDLGDTILDLIMDTAGSVVAIYYSKKHLEQSK